MQAQLQPCASLDAQDVVLGHAVVVQLVDQALHHVIEAGAQPAAGHDGGGDRLGVVEDRLTCTWAAGGQAGGRSAAADVGAHAACL